MSRMQILVVLVFSYLEVISGKHKNALITGFVLLTFSDILLHTLTHIFK
jgi:hypothetical protein